MILRNKIEKLENLSKIDRPIIYQSCDEVNEIHHPINYDSHKRRVVAQCLI